MGMRVDNNSCVFFLLGNLLFFVPFEGVFARELPVPGPSVGSKQPYPYPERL